VASEDGHYYGDALALSREERHFCAALSAELEAELGFHRLIIRRHGDRLFIQGPLAIPDGAAVLEKWLKSKYPRLDLHLSISSVKGESGQDS
jgi:hypothetical protein